MVNSTSPSWGGRAARFLGVVTVTLALLVAAGPAFADGATVRNAAKKCHVKKNLADHGRTITLDTVGEEDSGVGDDISDVACVLLALKAPTFVVTEIDNTRALDGMQRDHWRGFKASWTYHPDDGLNIVIHQ
jgi:hypothetical protein